ncbi:MAG: xanthine dehydrogenase family protein molybdopterin-binding subunit [Methyloligellaceae bacterium]
MKKRGIGMAVMWYPVGPGGSNPGTARLQMDEFGKLTIYVSCPDVGQGSSTALSQIAADAVGVPLDWIDKVIAVDSDHSPTDFGSVGSRVTYVQGNAVRLAGENMRKILQVVAQEMMNTSVDRIKIANGKAWDSDHIINPVHVADIARNEIEKTNEPLESIGTFEPSGVYGDRETGQAIVYPTFVYATQIAEVEVDTQTGEVKVTRMVAAHDSGQIINPMLVDGQIAGGIAQGIGMALSEEVLIKNGRTLNPSLSDYFLPTAMEIPDIEMIHVETTEDSGPYGAKCVGEPALVATAPAIINAIHDATGVRITSLPATPEKVLEALHDQIQHS